MKGKPVFRNLTRNIGLAVLLPGFLSNAIARTTVEPGIWHRPLSQVCGATEPRERLIRSLRKITGLSGLDFARDGALFVPQAPTANCDGSELARRLLEAAVTSGDMFIVENHFRSSKVHFGQIDAGTNYFDALANLRTTIWKVKLDFGDFDDMQASPRVRAAFDEGFALLHELLHARGYSDSMNINELGECESVLNVVRDELGLPQRAEYRGNEKQMTGNGLTSVRIRFRSRASAKRHENWKDDYLFFLVWPPQD